jgi:hypothetical protein
MQARHLDLNLGMKKPAEAGCQTKRSQEAAEVLA